jgi:glycosyltransferase involved in cell wall biosynthesis
VTIIFNEAYAFAGNVVKKLASSKRLRVLISSHEFTPDRGSECAVGWNIVTRMALHHDVTVLCADGPALFSDAYRDEVSNYFNHHGEVPNLRVVFVEQPPIAIRYARINRRLMTLTRGIGWQPLYYMGLDGWHWAAFQRAKDLGLENFDLVHQLTPISFRKPGYLWATGLPFYWGPIGGMYKVPWDFARMGGMSSLLFEAFRSGDIEWQTRLSGQFKAALRNAKRIWTVSEDEARIINAITKERISPMIDTAPPSDMRGYVRNYDGIRPLRLCWSGRHEAIKALPLLLQALELLPGREKVALDILGGGPETQRWQLLAKKLSLPNVTWHGLLPYHEALQTMGQADILIHSSFREAASMVVLEALGLGMPVICHDVCGMAVAVDDTCGMKVSLMNPKRSIRGFRDALDSILRNPGLVEQLSKGALLRAAELSWDAKTQEIAEAYTQG